MERQTRIIPLIVSILIGAIFWLLPVPAGVEPAGIQLLGIFVATIVGIVSKALPMAAVALVGLAATILTNTLSFSDAFSGFNHPVVWLIVAAFFIARGFTKTGLGSRIAYHFVRLLGKRTLGLSYGLLATELILAPAIPSNTARAGGIIFPILDSLSRSFGSDPEMGTARRMGSFLTMVAIQGTCITSAMFLTAMANNPLIANFAAEQGVTISWGDWAIAALVPGVISLVLMPLILYKVYPPAVRVTPHARRFAQVKLAELGKIKLSEWLMLGTFVLLLILWIFGGKIGISPTTAAILGLCLLLIFEVITWNDVLNEHGAWQTLFWFASLIAMASYLGKLGVIQWVGHNIGMAVQHLSWPIVYLLLAIIYFYIHYFFASLLAHVVSMYPIFLAVMIAAGAPPIPSALILAFSSSLFAGLTHYASGPAAILYGSGYVPVGSWWKLAGLMSMINLIIWIGLGGLWWALLSLW